MTETETMLHNLLLNCYTLINQLNEKINNLTTIVNNITVEKSITSSPLIEDINAALIEGSLALAPSGLPVIVDRFSNPDIERFYNIITLNNSKFSLVALDIWARSYIGINTPARMEVINYLLAHGWSFIGGWFYHDNDDIPEEATREITFFMIICSGDKIFTLPLIKNKIIEIATLYNLIPSNIIDVTVHIVFDMLDDVRGEIKRYSENNMRFTMAELFRFYDNELFINNVVRDFVDNGTFKVNNDGSFTNVYRYHNISSATICKRAINACICKLGIGIKINQMDPDSYIDIYPRNVNSNILEIPSIDSIRTMFVAKFSYYNNQAYTDYSISEEMMNSSLLSICRNLIDLVNVITRTTNRQLNVAGYKERFKNRYNIIIDDTTMSYVYNAFTNRG